MLCALEGDPSMFRIISNSFQRTLDLIQQDTPDGYFELIGTSGQEVRKPKLNYSSTSSTPL